VATAGCRTVSDRTLLNKALSEPDRRRREGERLKKEGNDAFAAGLWTEAEEFYTSSLLTFDENPVVFTNRAQARLKLEKYAEAIEDCRQVQCNAIQKAFGYIDLI
jgi:tetratricopeptide (TPR) repeat protein